MMDPSAKAEPVTEPELGKLLDDLVRDGWLLDMNAGLDPAMARMDAATGVFNPEYFSALTQEAVADHERNRDPRPGDGPERGAVAVVSVRLLDLDGLRVTLGDAQLNELLNQIARRLEQVLRAEDLVGRTRSDTFSLLLRGCPPPMLAQISGRCVEAVDAQPFEIAGRSLSPRVVAGIAEWTDGSASDVLHASWQAIGIA